MSRPLCGARPSPTTSAVSMSRAITLVDWVLESTPSTTERDMASSIRGGRVAGIVGERGALFSNPLVRRPARGEGGDGEEPDEGDGAGDEEGFARHLKTDRQDRLV